MCILVCLCPSILGLQIGIMEKNMETTVIGYSVQASKQSFAAAAAVLPGCLDAKELQQQLATQQAEARYEGSPTVMKLTGSW